MNHLTILVYQFIKAYYLYCLQSKQESPTLDMKFIELCYKVLTVKDNRGRKLDTDRQIIFDKLDQFYYDHFQDIAGPKMSRTNIGPIIEYSSVTIHTALQNNIKVHFIKRLFRYINVEFNVPKKSKTETEKLLKQQIGILKKDLLVGTTTCDPAYHDWLSVNRNLLVPKEFEKSIHYDLACNPLKYLSHTIWINQQLENKGAKLFHTLPLRTNIVPKCVDIDTSVIIKLLLDSNKQSYAENVKLIKPTVWNKFFDMKNDIFKPPKGYTFDDAIKTDGINLSVRFVRSDQYGKFRKPKKPKETEEFTYLDDLSQDKKTEIKQTMHPVYVDPNKGNLIYCIDDENTVFRYTRKQRLTETQRLKNQRAINKFKNDNKLKVIETSVSEENSKTCNFEKFMKYLKVKNEANNLLFIHYENEFIRKLNLRTYINTQRSESKLIRNMRRIYGENTVLIYGDCNVGKQMKHIISTPMIGLKRTLAKYFPVYNFDEFRTSCLDWRTEKYNSNAKVKLINGNTKSLHSVLVSNIPKYNSSGEEYFVPSFQNRDRNSVMNIRKLSQLCFHDEPRPLKYQRGIKLLDNGDIAVIKEQVMTLA